MKLSFAEIDSQHVELLPARTAMSLFNLGGCCSGGGGTPVAPSGGDACVVSIGNLSLPIGILLGAATATGSGTSC